ncbi:conserved hypothetical protein [Burkholderia cenocepacia]|nr:conserved hypothetical protein [Burkholderia cenocepacia]
MAIGMAFLPTRLKVLPRCVPPRAKKTAIARSYGTCRGLQRIFGSL